MNRLNFLQTGGFPLDLNVLDQMQTAYKIFNSLGSIAGELTFIQGCTVTGSTVSDGIVYINGEVLEFRGGGLAESVIIVQDAETKVFESGSSQEVHYIRYATFGTAAVSWLWSDFKRPIETKEIPENLLTRLETLEKKTAVFQSGCGMVLWNRPAAEIPPGWQEVVNWRGRVPVGFDSTQPEFNTMGEIGGAKSKTLSISEMPRHRHRVSHNSGVGNGDRSEPWEGYSGGGDYTDYEGGGQGFSIMNPYRVVMFIEFVG